MKPCRHTLLIKYVNVCLKESFMAILYGPKLLLELRLQMSFTISVSFKGLKKRIYLFFKQKLNDFFGLEMFQSNRNSIWNRMFV